MLTSVSKAGGYRTIVLLVGQAPAWIEDGGVSVRKRVRIPTAQPLYLFLLPCANTRVSLDDLGDGTAVEASAAAALPVANLTM